MSPGNQLTLIPDLPTVKRIGKDSPEPCRLKRFPIAGPEPFGRYDLDYLIERMLSRSRQHESLLNEACGSFINRNFLAAMFNAVSIPDWRCAHQFSSFGVLLHPLGDVAWLVPGLSFQPAFVIGFSGIDGVGVYLSFHDRKLGI